MTLNEMKDLKKGIKLVLNMLTASSPGLYRDWSVSKSPKLKESGEKKSNFLHFYLVILTHCDMSDVLLDSRESFLSALCVTEDPSCFWY